MSTSPRALLGLLMLALLLGPLGAYTTLGAPAAAPEAVAPAAATTLTPITENEPANPNGAPATADPIGDKNITAWLQEIHGEIGRSDDIDYYQITLTQPASGLKIRLSNLSGDYDLVLASARNDVEEGESGLEGITDIGGQINSIGGQINSIGGQINSIGGQINSIGGQINSISANGGSLSEEIATFLWQPGVYYVVVAPSNGAFGGRYKITVQLDGSSLAQPPPAPEVQLNIPSDERVTTLYITSFQRMRDLYTAPIQSSAILTVENQIGQLNGLPIDATGIGAELEHGFAIDLFDLTGATRFSPTIDDLYTDWMSGTNQLNPFYANRIAQVIRNVVKAATSKDGTSGPAPGLIYSLPQALAQSGAPFPNLKYVVLVGPDDVLPQFRVPDLTTIANEADYATYLAQIDPAGVVRPASPQGAALRYRMLLTDAPFSGDAPYRFFGFPFFLPERSVGRLVETPDDIRRYLQWWLDDSNPSVYRSGFQISLGPQGEPKKAFISGYDFLKDEAAAISVTLGLAGLDTGSFDTRVGLNNDLWNRLNLEDKWFEGDLASEFQQSAANDPLARHNFSLFSLNAHFDHWQLLPARSGEGNFLARRLLAPDYAPNPSCFGGCNGYFGGTLGYSVGCHSGYNVVDAGIVLSAPANRGQEPTYRADFAQALQRHAGTWIGNTGYGYGTADGIDYSERLALLLTQELARDVTVEFDPGNGPVQAYIGNAIGGALSTAKQRYVRNSTMLTVYDVKALTIMTLYGLPFIRASVPTPIAPPAEDPRVGAPSVPLETNAPIPPINSLGRLERTITVTIDVDASDYVDVARTGSSLLELDNDDFTITDTFVLEGFPQPGLRVYSNNQIGRPTLPTFAYDISALSHSSTEADPVRLEVRDVQFLGGEYGLESAFDPQVTQVVTETDDPIAATDDEPTFAAGAGLWYPDKFFGYSSVGSGSDQRDQLTAVAAQFKAAQGGLTGTLRPYTQMVFKVLYIDPLASEAETATDDEDPPVIESVELEPISTNLRQSGSVRLVVQVSDGATGLDGVSAVYVQGSTWKELSLNELDPSGAPGEWSALLPLQAGRVQVIVSATDKAGNTAYYTAKGTFSPPPPARLYLPIIAR